MTLWAALWRSCNALDGPSEFVVYDNYLPALFRTRDECRAFIKKRFGYIAQRPDLRVEPHGWRMPVPVVVTVEPAPRNRENPSGECCTAPQRDANASTKIASDG